MKQQYFLLQIQQVIHITPLQTYLQSRTASFAINDVKQN